jgi:mannose-6-phosphate isomerase-like protein (cupin superfamily)
MGAEYKDCVIPKPWGYEYLIYENDDLSIWYLSIAEGASTSLHCHPGKKTGLIVLDGCARVSLIERAFDLFKGQKVMIRAGAFHRTGAAPGSPLALLEVETPKSKGDLVRISDAYGRRNEQYESLRQPRKDEFYLPCNQVGSVDFSGYSLEIIRDISREFRPADQDLLVALNSAMFVHDEYELCPRGEILSGRVFNQLAADYRVLAGLEVLKVSSLHAQGL